MPFRFENNWRMERLNPTKTTVRYINIPSFDLLPQSIDRTISLVFNAFVVNIFQASCSGASCCAEM